MQPIELFDPWIWRRNPEILISQLRIEKLEIRQKLAGKPRPSPGGGTHKSGKQKIPTQIDSEWGLAAGVD